MSKKVYQSPFPDLEIEAVDLVSKVFSNPFNTPLSRPLYIDAVTGEQYTYGHVITRTQSLAHGLQREFSLKADDVVALFSPNTIEYPIACHAIIGSQAIVAPTSAALTSSELHAQLKTSSARFIIVHTSLLSTAQAAAKGTSVEKVIVLNGQSPTQPTCQQLASTYPATPLREIPPREAPLRTAFICFSSGTSGPAKGVITTHQNITANLQQWRAQLLDSGSTAQRIDRNTAIAFLPFSHIYGLNLYICQCLLWGTPVVILPRFDLDLYLSCIEKYRPQELALVPPIALMLVKDDRIKKFDLRSVRRILSAAAPLTSDLAAALEQRFADLFGTEVFCTQSWGLTETSPIATGIPNDRMDKRGSGVGCIVPNMEFRFVDPDTLVDVPEGTSGEIWCRGPNVTPGYYNNVEATRGTFHVDEDGTAWFRTGDIGAIDDEGYIALHDRIKEMIKYKGMQVIPSELEGKLLGHPDVVDAAVVGVWVDEMATELPAAFVTLRGGVVSKDRGATKVAEEIQKWLNERVANHKRLRGGVHVVESIPKSPSGKILRRLLKQQLTAARKARL
jgi:acyl-CoA synthetase (AMP-forming)/AMP-acid ligase II